MAKYDPLFRRLCQTPDEPIGLTFDAIAQLVGGLPKSALKYRPWWGNEVDGRHMQAQAWLNAGREVEAVDLDARAVRFGPAAWRRGA